MTNKEILKFASFESFSEKLCVSFTVPNYNVNQNHLTSFPLRLQTVFPDSSLEAIPIGVPSRVLYHSASWPFNEVSKT